MQGLFITTNDIVKFTNLNGNLDPDIYTQYIYQAQQLHIQNYLGTKLYDKINDGIVNSNLAEPYLSLLNTYIKSMVTHWSMVEFMPFSAYTFGNKGVYKHNSENSENVDKTEIDFLIEKERSIAEHYTRRFIDYMSFNQAQFPEYNTNNNADMFPDKESDFGGWYL